MYALIPFFSGVRTTYVFVSLLEVFGWKLYNYTIIYARDESMYT